MWNVLENLFVVCCRLTEASVDFQVNEDQSALRLRPGVITLVTCNGCCNGRRGMRSDSQALGTTPRVFEAASASRVPANAGTRISYESHLGGAYISIACLAECQSL